MTENEKGTNGLPSAEQLAARQEARQENLAFFKRQAFIVGQTFVQSNNTAHESAGLEERKKECIEGT